MFWANPGGRTAPTAGTVHTTTSAHIKFKHWMHYYLRGTIGWAQSGHCTSRATPCCCMNAVSMHAQEHLQPLAGTNAQATPHVSKTHCYSQAACCCCCCCCAGAADLCLIAPALFKHRAYGPVNQAGHQHIIITWPALTLEEGAAAVCQHHIT